MVRRFEFIQGNQAKFWEIARRGAVLTISSGRIGGSAKTRTKQQDDFMAAEQEFDRLIRDRLRRGYVEVQEASAAPPTVPDRELRLVALDGGDEYILKPAAMRYLTWRLVEIGVMDKQAKGPDLKRWEYRASRLLRTESVPELGDEGYEAFRKTYLDISKRDRATEARGGGGAIIGAYKFEQGSDWIITGREAETIASSLSERSPKRHKVSTNQQGYIDGFVAFNRQTTDKSGYTIELVRES